MEHAQVELLGFSEMPHTGHKRLPERAIIGPSGKDFVDGRVMDGGFALGIGRHGQALPLHPRVEHPQDKVEKTMIAQFKQNLRSLRQYSCQEELLYHCRCDPRRRTFSSRILK